MKKNMMYRKAVDFLFYGMLLLLCAALLAGTALADGTGIVTLEVDNYDELVYGDTFEDGGILLYGGRKVPGDSASSRPWLVCLNADRTVRWEYLDDTGTGYAAAAVLRDGTAWAVLLRAGEDGGKEYVLRHFTENGEPAGKDAVLSTEGKPTVRNVTKSRLQLISETEPGKWENRLMDWDGNEIARFDEFSVNLGFCTMTEDEDSLIMTGNIRDGGFRQVIRKTDLQGSVLWETELPWVYPGAVSDPVYYIARAEDGGYFVLRSEAAQPAAEGEKKYISRLVKLDSEGQIVPADGESFEALTGRCKGFTACGGKFAAYFLITDDEKYMNEMSDSREVLWFDKTGKYLGSVNAVPDTENFERLAAAIRERPDADKLTPVFRNAGLIPMQDGLWLIGAAAIQEEDGGTPMKYYDTVLINIPEP